MSGLFVIAQGRLTDDAYITLAYVRNLAFHFHWGLNPYETANTATSPLNVIALGLLTAILRNAVAALGVLYVVVGIGSLQTLLRICRRQRLAPWTAVLAWSLVIFNPILLSSVGLETQLGVFFLLLLLLTALECRPAAFGLIGGLLVLTRIDLLLFVVPFFCLRDLRARWKKITGIALGLSAPWFLWSWVALGSIVPNTLLLKLDQRGWGGWTFRNGAALYFEHYPLATVAAFVPGLVGIALMVWALARRQRSETKVILLFGAGGILYFAIYSGLEVPPYHWYYGPSLAVLSVVALLLLGRLPTARTSARRGHCSGLMWSLTLGGLAQVAICVGEGVGSAVLPISSNWAPAREYLAIGRQMAPIVGRNGVFQSNLEIGTIAFGCQCLTVQNFSDPGIASMEVRSDEARDQGLLGWLLQLNYLFLGHVPPVATQWVLTYQRTPPAHGVFWRVHSPWYGTGYIDLARRVIP